MAFKLLYTNLAGPQGDFLVDSAASFEAGMVGTISGNSTGLPVVYLAGGAGANTAVGIIDDNKTSQFIATVTAEAVTNATTTLNHANIVAGTFASGSCRADLTSATNGTVTVLGTGTVSYSYYIPGKAGDDTTLASGKCTLWLQSGEYATDVYEVASAGSGLVTYSVGSKLYSSTNSKLTSTAPIGATTVSGVTVLASAVVGYVTKAPTAGNPFLNFYKI
jgi:hypothetical protein